MDVTLDRTFPSLVVYPCWVVRKELASCPAEDQKKLVFSK